MTLSSDAWAPSEGPPHYVVGVGDSVQLSVSGLTDACLDDVASFEWRITSAGSASNSRSDVQTSTEAHLEYTFREVAEHYVHVNALDASGNVLVNGYVARGIDVWPQFYEQAEADPANIFSFEISIACCPGAAAVNISNADAFPLAQWYVRYEDAANGTVVWEGTYLSHPLSIDVRGTLGEGYRGVIRLTVWTDPAPPAGVFTATVEARMAPSYNHFYADV